MKDDTRFKGVVSVCMTSLFTFLGNVHPVLFLHTNYVVLSGSIDENLIELIGIAYFLAW